MIYKLSDLTTLGGTSNHFGGDFHFIFMKSLLHTN